MEALVAAFAAGLLGGSHCVGMCGGIAGALGSEATARGRGTPIAMLRDVRSARRDEAPKRAAGGSWGRLLAFNAGRIGTYAAAGALAGALGNAAMLAGPVETGRIVAYAAAQAMLVLLGLYIAGWTALLPRFEAAGGMLWRRIGPLRRFCFPVDSAGKAMAAGAVWGFVPCGLVYGMLPFALAGGSAQQGALILVAFGAGTLPWLLAAGSLGVRFARFRHNGAVRKIAGIVLIGLALASLVRLAVHAH